MKLTTWTKRLIVIAGTAIVITSMFTGHFSELIQAITSIFK